MSAVVIRPRLRRAIFAVTALTCVAVFASTGVALASCPTQPVSTPFSQWGDSNDYFLVPGGSFEGTPDQVGWTLSNASLTSGNESFNVNDPGDQRSLTINGGGSATSPYFRVKALLQNSDGSVTAVPLADLADGSMPTWAPTDSLGGSGHVPAGSSMMVALRFRAPVSSGSWQIDDIYVDPYRSG